MKHRTLPTLVILALLFAATFGIGIGQASPSTQGNSAAAVHLKAATFRPTNGEAPAIRPGLAIAGYARGQRGYYLVQFRGPVEQAWKDQVAGQGAELLDYVPDYTFKVRMTPEQARQVAGLSDVAWVGLFHPAYKLDTNLKRSGTQLYRVRVERGTDAGLATAAIVQSGAQVIRRDGQLLIVAADSAQLDALARVSDVAWVENFALWQKHDQYARAIIGADVANAAHNGNPSLAYDGSTQTVAVADTGLGGGTTSTAHPDINGRVTAIYNWPGTTDSCFQQIVNDGAQDVDSGHGTHVAGSVLSNGASSPGGLGKGVAPAAHLVFQATENWVITSNLCKNFYGYQNDYYLAGLPSDLHQLFQQAYDAGARIHSNSWGSASAGDYTLNSANADDFIWGHRNMLITFSAGNEGVDANSDGVVDNDSIGSPATAKNVLTVGASENDRQSHYECDTSLLYQSRDVYQPNTTCSGMGGNNILGTYGVRWPADYPANPLKDDPTAGNAGQMASFSSRGPTDDGRIKPDVVAPGTWVLSTYSDNYQEGYDASPNPQNNAYQLDGWGMPVNQYYKYFGGTSMSNPLTAGAAAVVRDYYQKAKGIDASAALVKASLINSAVDMLDENNDGVNDNDYPIPNNHEGWGRVDVNAATDGSAQYAEESAGLSTNGTSTYSASVSTNGAPLRITLVWSDYASTETASINLVNDLDLEVTSPTGTLYRGNVFSGGSSQTGGSADRRNNVENVYVSSAGTGTWTIAVKGFNVPNGPQKFALVVDGAATLAAPPPPPAAPSSLTATAISKSQINLSWVDNSNDETGFKIERSTNANSGFSQIATVGAGVTTYQNTGLSGNTTYYYRVRATNANGDSVYSNTASAKTPRK